MKRTKESWRLRALVMLLVLSCCPVLAFIPPARAAAGDDPELIFTEEYDEDIPGKPIICGSRSGEAVPSGPGVIIIRCDHGHNNSFGYTDEGGEISCDYCGASDISAKQLHMQIHFVNVGCRKVTGHRPGARIESSLEVYSDGSAVLEYSLSGGEEDASLRVTLGEETEEDRSGRIETEFTKNGTFTAEVYYSDEYKKEWTFTIDTLPVEVSFIDPAGIREPSTEIMYMHKEAEEVPVELRYGYLFNGYSDEDGVKSYDAEGKLLTNYIKYEQMHKVLNLEWEPKKYNVYYTYIDNGIPEYRSELLTFDAPLPSIPVNTSIDIENGRVFCGYCLDDLILYDAYGEPVPEKLTRELDPMQQHYGKLVLSEIWRPIDLNLYYGEDADSDGRPDMSVHIREGVYPDLPKLPVRPGYRFLGLDYAGTGIYTGDGKPDDGAIDGFIVDWVRSGSDIIADTGWEIKSWDIRYGEDVDLDGVPDRIKHVQYGDVIPSLEDTGTKEESTRAFLGWGVGNLRFWDGEGQPLLETLETDLDPWANERGEVILKGIWERSPAGGGRDDTEGSGDDEEGEEDPPADPAPSASENSVSNNGTGGTPGPGEGEPSDDDGDEPESEAETTSLTQPAAPPEQTPDGETGAEQEASDPEDAQEAEEQPVAGTDPDADPGALENEIRRSPAVPNTGESGESAAAAVIKRIAKAAAVTGGVSGALLGAYMGLVYLTAMAEIWCIGSAGKMKRLGKLTIRSERGEAFCLKIPKRFIEQCDTGRILVRIPGLFALHNRKHELIIEAGGTILAERIRREIRILVQPERRN